MFEGNDIHIRFKDRTRGNFTFVEYDEEENTIIVEDDDSAICQYDLADIRTVKVIRGIADNPQDASYFLPRTDKTRRRVPLEKRLSIIQELYRDDDEDKSDLTKHFFEVLQTYGATNIDQLNKAERKRFFDYLREQWKILEESANYILFVSYAMSKKYGILSPKTLERRHSKEREQLPNDDVFNEDDFTQSAVQREIYKSGAYENQYAETDYDLHLKNVYKKDFDYWMIKLFSQSFTQEEIAEITGATRSKVRTHRKHLGKKYKDNE